MRELVNATGLVLLMVFLLFSCGKKEEPEQFFSVLPKDPEQELHFRGYVTDENEKLLSEIYYFSRKLVDTDTTNGHAVQVYESNGDIMKFYVDDAGTIWQLNEVDVGKRIVVYNLSYKQPLIVRNWEILLKIDGGKGTEWSVNIDTTFEALNLEGEPQVIRYVKQGKARYEGWTKAFIPEPDTYNYVPAVDAHWYDLNSYIINETADDTLFASLGSAHQYFHSELGAIKFITDFTKKEIGQEPVVLHGTWELVRKDL